MERESDTTPKRRKSEITTQRQSTHFDVNVIYAQDGSRSVQTRRSVVRMPLRPIQLLCGVKSLTRCRTLRTQFKRERGRRMRIGIRRRMGVSQFMVSWLGDRRRSGLKLKGVHRE